MQSYSELDKKNVINKQIGDPEWVHFLEDHVEYLKRNSEFIQLDVDLFNIYSHSPRQMLLKCGITEREFLAVTIINDINLTESVPKTKMWVHRPSTAAMDKLEETFNYSTD